MIEPARWLAGSACMIESHSSRDGGYEMS